MKKVLKFILFLIIILNIQLLLLGCNHDKCSGIFTDDGWNSFWNKLSSEEKEFIISKISKLENNEGSEKFAGRFIDGSKAVAFTTKYVEELNVDNESYETAVKSVYFTLIDLENFLEQAKKQSKKNKSFACIGEPGVRFYFAKYTSGNGSMTGKQTMIARLTCDKSDLNHNLDNMAEHVAFNFGDVCPPVCKMNANITCSNGRYQYNDSPILENCR